MSAIFRRDFASYFHTFVGWLFIAVLWFFISLYAAMNNFVGLDSSLANSVSIAVLVLLVLIPVLTMRTFAGERRNKTDQLILTAPVSVPGVVLGKFLAAAAVFTIPIVGICAYPLIFSMFGKVPMAVNYLAILGLWLYGLTGIAISIFASSLTENPIISAVLSFAILFISFTMKAITSFAGGVAGKIAQAFDVPTRFDLFLNGTLDLSAVIYLLSVTVLFLFFTVQCIQKRRYSVRKGNISLGAFSLLGIVIAACAVVGINFASAKIPDNVRVVDFTENRIYSLTDTTKDFVKDIDQDVNIYVLAKDESQDETIAKTLGQYQALNSHISVKYVDPSVDTTFASKYTDEKLGANSLIVEGPERSKTIQYGSLYEVTVNAAGGYEMTGYDAEGQITSALSFVTTSELPKIYLLQGHNESELDPVFAENLAKMNVASDTLSLLNQDAVPEDAEAVLINAPAADISADDEAKLEAYAAKGGKLLITLNFLDAAKAPNLMKLLEFYGVKNEAGIIVETDRNHYLSAGQGGGIPTYLLPNVSKESMITQQVIAANGYVFVPFAQALTHGGSDDTFSYTDFLTTSAQAFVHANMADMNDASKIISKDDPQGTWTVGLRAEKTIGENHSTAVIYSSPEIFTSSADQIVAGSNQKLFAGTVGSMVKMAKTLTVDSKSFRNPLLTVTASTAIMLSAVCVLLVPLALLIAGFVIWMRRRRR
ncbi:ABC-2 type transport system permease protein [[Clostridium] aminophilum]|uniref:ABC-2 type transport system permease protein n=1 Tax=[Clostridium] aminophilum TaxID=1526 RepID=A0A1I0FZ09_9FIRM|nr:Gldg family protein [[Clostridium] aminophilum]SET63515.1 ABC-2 type transport system permease protein [[Clostridium] aminophilum]